MLPQANSKKGARTAERGLDVWVLIVNYKRCCGGGGAAQAAPDPVCKDLMNGIIPN